MSQNTNELQTESTEALLALLQGDDFDTGKRAAKELGRRGDIVSLKQMVAQFDWRDADDPIKAETDCQTLLDRTYASPVPFLLDVLHLYGIHYYQHTYVICALAGIGKPAVEPLLEALNPQCIIPFDIVDALGQIGDDRAIPAIYERLPELGIVSLKALLRFGDAGVQAVVMALRSGNDYMRQGLLKTLAQIDYWYPHEAIVEALIECLQEKRFQMVIHAIWALGSGKIARAVPYIIPHLDDPDMEYEAKEALESIGTPEAIAAVDKWWKKKQLS